MGGGPEETMAHRAKSKDPFTDEFAEFARKTMEEWKVPGVSIAVIDGDDVYAKVSNTVRLQSDVLARSASKLVRPLKPNLKRVTLGLHTGTDRYARNARNSLVRRFHDQGLHRRRARTPHRHQSPPAALRGLVHAHLVHPPGGLRPARRLGHEPPHARGCGTTSPCSGSGTGSRSPFGTWFANLRNLAITEEPRVKFQYCNLMYVVLSHVVETLTDKELGHVIKEVIWEPLGMKSTYFDLEPARAGPEHLASGYYWDVEKEEYRKVSDMSLTEISGAGAIFSNVLDYAKWVQCLLHQTTPFSEATHRDIRTPRILAGVLEVGADVSAYGLGWSRTVYRGHVLYKHDGGVHAFGSEVYWLPNANFGVVAFGNTAGTSNAAEDVLAYKLIHDKLGLEPDTSERSKWWHSIYESFPRRFEDVLDIVYPNRADPPLPPTLKPEDLAGTYYDDGYKEITLRIEAHPDNAGQEILVADHQDATWKCQIRMHHVSGDWWLLYFVLTDNPTLKYYDAVKAEFKIGPDGKATGLEVEWWVRVSNMYEGKTLFKRVDKR